MPWRGSVRACRYALTLTMQQCHQSAYCAKHASQRITHTDPNPRWRKVWVTCQVAKTSHRLGNTSESRSIPVWTGLSIAGNTHENDIWIDRFHCLIPQIPLLQCPWSEVFQHNIHVG